VDSPHNKHQGLTATQHGKNDYSHHSQSTQRWRHGVTIHFFDDAACALFIQGMKTGQGTHGKPYGEYSGLRAQMAKGFSGQLTISKSGKSCSVIF
jgi:hypothetical protein